MLITLASGSPRRRQLLALTGWPALVRPITVDETAHAGEAPEELARRLALTKAQVKTLFLAGREVKILRESDILAKVIK